MKFYNTFKRSNGRYTTQEWSAEEMFNYDIMKFCIIAVLGTLLSVLTSGICLLIRLYEYEENEKAPNIWGGIVALYLLIDYWRGWFITFVLNIIEDTETIKLMMVCNFAILITHILILIFGDTVFYNIEEEVERKYTLVIYSVVSLVLFYFVGTFIIN